ncbi:hypothetical protein B0A49_04496 [Cryomyces minteri]|uniref:FAD-binding PCMH-type domain-containing protein n=1 Tax=Cryomyces minteri TaxID=331657 RepID=A0A4V5NF57_9PEZI|nr:hypothetical protein B0A49_04496 [Cryomyces minteri]
MAAQELKNLTARLSPSEYLTSEHPSFAKEVEPWSLDADLHPSLLVTPSTLASLQDVVRYLYKTQLDFAIRTTGTGSSSAKDVILSLKGFKEFNFDASSETVTLGAGLAWGEVDQLLEKYADGYAVVGARCPYVGVGGSTLVGGLSWLAHEYGLISDPQNMLDAHVVLNSGHAVWASSAPDLLWALRGGGGNFGVVTSFKFKAHRYTKSIFSGLLTIPYANLSRVSAAVANVAANNPDPKVAMHVFTMNGALGFQEIGGERDIGILVYDANGEEHARSEAGFKWALDMPGCVAQTGVMRLSQVHALALGTGENHGKRVAFMSAPLISDVDEEFLVRAWKWRTDSLNASAALAEDTFVLFEFMQEASPELKRLALQRLLAAAEEVAGPGKATGEYLPNFFTEAHDIPAVFGENWGELRRVKGKYDPLNRFNKGTLIPPAKSENSTRL